MPETVRDDFRAAVYIGVVRSVLLYRGLLRLQEILSHPSPIPIVPLRGVPLLPRLALRSLGDVDILLPQERVEEAVPSLRARGYREYREHIPDGTPGSSRLIGMHVTLDSSEALPVHIEVHWTLAASD